MENENNPSPEHAPDQTTTGIEARGPDQAATGAESHAADQTTHGAEAHEAHAFDPIMGQLIPTFNFLVFALLAYFFLKGPIKKAMTSKRQSYLDLKAEAEKLKREAEAQLAEAKLRNSVLEKEVAEIVAKGTEDALKESERILNEARSLAAHINLEAKRIAATELAEAKRALEKEIMGTIKNEIITKVAAELSGERGQKYSQSLISNITQA